VSSLCAVRSQAPTTPIRALAGPSALAIRFSSSTAGLCSSWVAYDSSHERCMLRQASRREQPMHVGRRWACSNVRATSVASRRPSNITTRERSKQHDVSRAQFIFALSSCSTSISLRRQENRWHALWGTDMTLTSSPHTCSTLYDMPNHSETPHYSDCTQRRYLSTSGLTRPSVTCGFLLLLQG